MSSRLTTTMMTRNVLRDLNNTSERLERTRAKASSGKEITRPSDDPFGTARALKFRESLEGTRQHQRDATDAVGWQEVSEQALHSLSEAGLRVRELLIRGSSDTSDAGARKAIATEVNQIIEAIKEHGNANYAGRFVFGGTETLAPPFSKTDDLYHGNDTGIAREIGPGVSVVINQPGSKVLGTGGPGDLLGTLRSMVVNLEANDGQALRDGSIFALDANLDKLLSVRAENGANSTRLESALSRLAQFEETTTQHLSETEDADFAKTMIDLNSQQAAYQAALRAGATIVQSSLMDFLR